MTITSNSEITVMYNPADEIIKIKSSGELSHMNLYNILGKRIANQKNDGNELNFQTAGLLQGIYLVQVFDNRGTLTTKKIAKH